MSLDRSPPAERVRAAEGTRARPSAATFKLSFSERLRMQLETLKTGKKAQSPPGAATMEFLRLTGQPQGRPPETKTAWATATRDSGPVRPGRRLGSPPGEVASQMALQTLAAMFPARGQALAEGPLRFLHDAVIAGHHQLLRLRDRAFADGRRAPPSSPALPQATPPLGALRRLGCTWCAATNHRARGLLQRAAGDAVAGGAHRRALQPQRALHLPGQPRQNRWSTPPAR